MPKRISCPNCGGPLAIASAGLDVQTYHADVPAFGDWGFVLASNLKVDWSSLRLHAPTRFLKDELLPATTQFDSDLAEMPTDVSTLENPVVLLYYLEGGRRWRS